jgi:Protein of unknown function (DUF2283)
MTTPPKKYVHLRTYEGDNRQTYVDLADHPHELTSCVRRTVRVHNLIEGYDGPSIAIDFDENNRAIGIEILYAYEDDDVDFEE